MRRMLMNRFVLSVFGLCGVVLGARAELRVPAFTAYLDPEVEGARVSSGSGITGWKNPALKILWFGELKTVGQLDCRLTLRNPQGSISKLRLSIAGQSHEANISGAGTNLVVANFGSFEIKEAGCHRLTLESLNAPGQPSADIEALLLDGPASKDAHFNLKPRRNAASVHLSYPAPKDTKAEAFYFEVTALE